MNEYESWKKDCKKIIKEEQSDWLETMERFDNPDIKDMADALGI